MQSRFLVIPALAAALAVSPVAAQSAGTFELGGFGRMTWFDGDLGLEDQGGVGGRLGVFVLRNLAVEADASYTSTDAAGGASVTHLPVHAGLTYNFPVGEHTALLLGGRYAYNKYGRDADATDNGFGGLVGIRLGMGGLVSIRIDGTMDYMSDSELISDSYVNWGANAGISLLFGGRQGPKDGDRDGVVDAMDACPATPLGEAVDGRGCPLPKDADGDGVMDNVDACPNTPSGDRVDARGCPLPKDADGDGVVDASDACPATPRGEAVDARGCPLPKDSDGDGVMDNADRCANTPAGDRVDANGCSLPKDSDSDGVMDDADRCPNTPAGTRVDTRGCPALFQAQQTSLVLEGVNFATSSAVLTDEARVVLDKVAESLAANPDVRVEVAGYTSSTGSRSYNVRLSQSRAESVRAYLIAKGVPATQLTARGYGPDNPVADNATEEGRAQNRRVELRKLN